MLLLLHIFTQVLYVFLYLYVHTYVDRPYEPDFDYCISYKDQQPTLMITSNVCNELYPYVYICICT